MEEETQIDLFYEQIKNCERRYQEHDAIREARQEGLESGDWQRVDSAGRIARRLVSLGMEDAATEVVAADLEEEHDAGTLSAEAVLQRDLRSEEPNPLEKILEANDMLPINFLYQGSRTSQAIGRIVIRNGMRPIGYGTGFMISPRLMITNNHVLWDKDIAINSTIEFDYYRKVSGRISRPIEFRLEPFLFFATDKPLDFTIVAVQFRNKDGATINSRGWVPLIKKSGKSIVGERVNIVQHPGGRPQTIAIRENQIVDVLPNHLHYSADTEPGSSGAPVFNEQWELAALHHAGVPKRDRSRRILLRDGSVWDGSSSKKHLIAWIANEGVRISRIVTHMDKEIKSMSTLQRRLFEQSFEEPDSRSIFDESSETSASTINTATATPTVGQIQTSNESTITIPLTIKVGIGGGAPTTHSPAVEDPVAKWQEEFGDLDLPNGSRDA